MRKSKFSKSQVIKILTQQESGQSVSDIWRGHSISQGTLYSWKSRYSGLEVSQLKKAQEMEELAQYKNIVVQQALQITILRDVIEKSSRVCRNA